MSIGSLPEHKRVVSCCWFQVIMPALPTPEGSFLKHTTLRQRASHCTSGQWTAQMHKPGRPFQRLGFMRPEVSWFISLRINLCRSRHLLTWKACTIIGSWGRHDGLKLIAYMHSRLHESIFYSEDAAWGTRLAARHGIPAVFGWLFQVAVISEGILGRVKNEEQIQRAWDVTFMSL